MLDVSVSFMLPLCKITDSLLISNARSACNDELIQKEAVTLCINVSKQQADLYKYFDRCADAIHSEANRGGRTVVYCKNGRSRSATICVAYLMKHQGLTLTNAFEVMKRARPVVEPNQGFWAQLEQYEQEMIRRLISMTLGGHRVLITINRLAALVMFLSLTVYLSRY
uniref:Dual specificity phosphatase 28 n=1 Tax=Electrophorus electricus TaxID=8005 RepID=A0AAY5F1M4_ELEEL